MIECVRASVAIERVDQEARADATPRTPTRTRLVRRHAVSCPKLRRGQVRVPGTAPLVVALAQLARAEGRVTAHRVLPVWHAVCLRNASIGLPAWRMASQACCCQAEANCAGAEGADAGALFVGEACASARMRARMRVCDKNGFRTPLILTLI